MNIEAFNNGNDIGAPLGNMERFEAGAQSNCGELASHGQAVCDASNSCTWDGMDCVDSMDSENSAQNNQSGFNPDNCGIVDPTYCGGTNDKTGGVCKFDQNSDPQCQPSQPPQPNPVETFYGGHGYNENAVNVGNVNDAMNVNDSMNINNVIDSENSMNNGNLVNMNNSNVNANNGEVSLNANVNEPVNSPLNMNNEYVDDVDDVDEGSSGLINTDLLLKALVFGCVFYILSHKESLAIIKKTFKKLSDDNVLLLQMGVFVVVYYILNLFI